jgi:DNA-binding ferritin-like protein
VRVVKYDVINNEHMSNTASAELSNTAYDILKVLGKDADFLYDTIDNYIKDANSSGKSELVEMWQTIKKDRQKHVHMLKEALEKEIHG